MSSSLSTSTRIVRLWSFFIVIFLNLNVNVNMNVNVPVGLVFTSAFQLQQPNQIRHALAHKRLITHKSTFYIQSKNANTQVSKMKLNMMPLHSASSLQNIHSNIIITSTTNIDNLFLISEENSIAALDTLRTILITLTALIFGFAGLTYIVASFIIPKAAQQLEQDTKRLRPGLWEEYEAKLNKENGETMAMRPDLLQELGNIMQPIIIQDYENNSNNKNNNNSNGKDTSASTATRTTAIDDNKGPGTSGTMTNSNQWDD